ncbi:MAG TPA: T9SS type A sorting domain-containing protein [Flavobacterium sp.]
MKKQYLLLLLCFLFGTHLRAQTTEHFETEAIGSATFTDNGRTFTITSQAGGTFDVEGNYPGTGYTGANDHRYIDNSGSGANFMTPVQFTISSGAPFLLKSMYLFLTDDDLNLNITGTVTITGKLAGATVFTASSSSGFNNSYASNNGFTFINMSTYGGANNSNIQIDQFVINTTSGINYVALDGMTWQVPPCGAITLNQTSKTNVSCNGGSNGAATVSASGGSGFTYNWTPGNPSGDGTASVSGLTAGDWTVTVTSSCGSTASTTFSITQPQALTSTQSQSNVSCNGGSNGSATIIPTGGAGGYTYFWSPNVSSGATASGLSAGNYSVTVTDANGCTTSKNFTITSPNVLAASQSQTNVSCNGENNGTATVVASGGTGSYSYSWSPSGGNGATASGLSAGNYMVTITDANSCTIQKNFTISQPTSSLTATQSQSNVSCNSGNNGSATVVASGGAGSYSYSWSPSGGNGATASGLSAGNYTVTITDANNCSIQKNFTISSPEALTATQSQTNVSCNGGNNGSATVVASGGTGSYSYSWSPSGGTGATASGLSAGDYTVTVTDANSCSIQKNFTISAPSALTATQSQTNVSCNGGSNGSATVVASGGTGSYSYSWSPSGGTEATASGLSAGDYTVTITDANSCSIQKNFTISSPEALTATQSQNNVSCFGGSNGSATVVASGGTGSYSYSWSPSGGNGATASGLSAGDYTVTITDNNGCTSTETITISQPDALVATAMSQTNVSNGSDGSATVAVTGGTGDYSYSWSPSGGNAAMASGLSAGTYTVTVTDANGCTVTKDFTLVNLGPSTVIKASQCGSVLSNIYTAIVAVASVPNVTMYSFEITDTNTGAIQTISRNVNYFQLTDLNDYQYGRTYSVRVGLHVNGVWQGYGPACNVSTPMLNLQVSNCGGTLSNRSDAIFITGGSFIESYQIHVTNMTTMQSQTITRSESWFKLKMFTNIDYSYNTVYQIEVRGATTGVYSDWSIPCTIMTPAAPGNSAKASASNFKAVAYPNPYTDSFTLNVETAQISKIQVKIYDMVGKLLELRDVDSADLQNQRLGSGFPSGVYNVVVTQDGTLQSLRIIKR